MYAKILGLRNRERDVPRTGVLDVYPDLLRESVTLTEFVAGCLYVATQTTDYRDSYLASCLSSLNWGLYQLPK
jgi:hypothetical protein